MQNGKTGGLLVPLRTKPNSKSCHSVFMREHFIHLMDPNKPKGRTLFLLNVPPYVAEDSLNTVFSRAGSIQAVEFAVRTGKEETTKWYESTGETFSYARPFFIFKVAYIVFEKASSINKALALGSIDLFNTSGECIVKTGMELWHEEYDKNYLLEAYKAKVQIRKYMAGYDKRERAATEAAKSGESDADGWVTVGNEGRNAGFKQKASLIGRLEQKIRESKMQNIMEIRKKFEEDKRKIELLKQSRRFKPF
ncbi:ribosomal RNA-processing protein 7 homolog A-like isoform X3 [Drosophila suzukii]|uniref:Ribosomal RNA-processing protein 7 homolog A-like isoform X3 n=1 Tax=Drosophila suzukii TaxID=28584 RepID=A0ABM4U040_DROSZ|nr:ribosomal RNA-processing protein 7 homolog A-like isoform X3 [Drosophila suzukii]